jgi:hypothetical protein
MKDTIRSISATALLVLGFTRASGKFEKTMAPVSANPEAPTMFCLPCNCGE